MRTLTKKSIISLIIALIMILNLVPFGAISQVYATGTISNVNIASDGAITWDAIVGDVVYSYGLVEPNVYSGVTTETTGNIDYYMNLNSNSAGVYTVRVEAWGDGGNTLLAQTDTKVTYNGTTYAMGDTRAKVAELEATSNISEIAIYGNSFDVPTFNVTKGTPAYFETGMGNWLKKNGEEWENVTGVFTEGTYCYQCQVRIDSQGDAYKIDETATAKVDGNDWGVYSGYVGGTYSYIYVESQEITVTKITLPLTFNKDDNYNIGINYVSSAISSYSVVSGVVGGEEPYTFSKTSGPAWLNVSSDGTISGTPTSVGANDNLVIRVTDNEGTYKDITITVGNTLMDPNDREQVNELEATSNISEIAVYGHSFDVPTFNVAKGSPAYFETGMGHWYKKNGEDWDYATGTFTEGTYCYQCQVRIDGETGYTHILNETAAIKVDGNDWGVYSGYVGSTYSYVHASSQEIIIIEPHSHPLTLVPAKSATCKEAGNNTYYKCNDCGKVFKDSEGTVETTIEAETIAKVAHDYKTTTTKATLSKNGSIVTKCTVCGDVKSNTAIAYPKTIKLKTANYTYDGKAKKPAVIVTDSNGKTIASSNYTVKYSSNKKVGTATATITFKGNYEGTKKLTYKINPKGVSLKKLTKGSKQFKATWGKNTTQTTGYEVQYSTNKNFKSGNKKVTIKKNKTTSTTVKKLKAKKKYYVRIRTYKTVNGKKYYSGWSKVLNVKTKK